MGRERKKYIKLLKKIAEDSAKRNLRNSKEEIKLKLQVKIKRVFERKG